MAYLFAPPRRLEHGDMFATWSTLLCVCLVVRHVLPLQQVTSGRVPRDFLSTLDRGSVAVVLRDPASQFLMRFCQNSLLFYTKARNFTALLRESWRIDLRLWGITTRPLLPVYRLLRKKLWILVLSCTGLIRRSG